MCLGYEEEDEDFLCFKYKKIKIKGYDKKLENQVKKEINNFEEKEIKISEHEQRINDFVDFLSSKLVFFLGIGLICIFKIMFLSFMNILYFLLLIIVFSIPFIFISETEEIKTNFKRKLMKEVINYHTDLEKSNYEKNKELLELFRIFENEYSIKNSIFLKKNILTVLVKIYVDELNLGLVNIRILYSDFLTSNELIKINARELKIKKTKKNVPILNLKKMIIKLPLDDYEKFYSY